MRPVYAIFRLRAGGDCRHYSAREPKNLEVEKTMDELGALIGRKYEPVQYVGTPQDEYPIVALGSG